MVSNEITQADRELLAAHAAQLTPTGDREFKEDEHGSLIHVDSALRAIAAARRQAQGPSGGEVVAWMLEWDGTDDPTIRTFVMAEPNRDGLPEGAVVTPLYTAPPSAPVGVEGVLAEIRAAADAGGATEGKCYGWWRALAQQPAPSPDVARLVEAAFAFLDGSNTWPDSAKREQLRRAIAPFTAAQQEGAP